jgi:hypothetical protein
MSAGALLENLRRGDVRLEAAGGNLRVDAPVGAMSAELKAALAQLKPEMLELLERERPDADPNVEPDRSGLIIRWSEHPIWIELHDPTTGERHEVRASECLPSVVEAANRHLKKGGVA